MCGILGWGIDGEKSLVGTKKHFLHGLKFRVFFFGLRSVGDGQRAARYFILSI